ncbi:MAG TPA: OsmC family protein [Bryobacteraceae bacterium]|nr:OsmC family protein [Bryobacteraceae bacterium]
MSEFASEFTLLVDQVGDYEFRVKFDKPELADLTLDEPPPLGRDRGPNPARLLAAAIANCLSASLLFCTRRARVELGPIHAEVKMQIVRNENKRLRVGKVEVVIDPGLSEAEKEKAARCLEIFEDFCIVTQSVREGIDISVSVKSAS